MWGLYKQTKNNEFNMKVGLSMEPCYRAFHKECKNCQPTFVQQIYFFETYFIPLYFIKLQRLALHFVFYLQPIFSATYM